MTAERRIVQNVAMTDSTVVKSKAHVISISDLVIHKYAEEQLLHKKADSLVLSIIHQDLRPGEYVRRAKRGVYHVYMPLLRDDVAALRCAVLTEKAYRAVRELNPAAKAHPRASNDQMQAPRRLRSDGGPSTISNDDLAKRMKANQAVELMTAVCLSRAELLASPLAKFLAEKAQVLFQPVFFADNNMIVGHSAELMWKGLPLNAASAELKHFGRSDDEVTATQDIFVYTRALEFLAKKAAESSAPSMLICPVRLSTIQRSRYRAAYLEAPVPEIARQLLVLKVQTFTQPFSRVKVFDSAAYLRARARVLVADVGYGTDDMSQFKEAGFQSVGIDVRNHLGGRTAFLNHAEGLAARAKKAGLRTHIMGIENKDLVGTAIASGYSYIGGSWFAA
jgi:EAL domain-containing protein (putative c-di-GMP-specific phosphodiesterase class I)